ncbi:hypothetical protein niasHS_000776 [Heterodera schachtii]|uniref:Uncharacterized protein n=1 Tax=Heterodera schachtii TaxID=97005 RepID=A0ABD2KJ59_HETSC
MLRTLPGSGLAMRLSLVAGACVCITVKCVGGEILDLEPLDAKRLQAKNLHDYLQDIILAEKVDFVLDANHEWLHGEQVMRRCQMFSQTESTAAAQNANAAHSAAPPKTREIVSNVLHAGPIEMEHKIIFTTMRVAVVTCKSHTSDNNNEQPDDEFGEHNAKCIVSPNQSSAAAAASAMDTFEHQLRALLRNHGKTVGQANEVLARLAIVGMDGPVAGGAVPHSPPLSKCHNSSPSPQYNQQHPADIVVASTSKCSSSSSSSSSAACCPPSFYPSHNHQQFVPSSSSVIIDHHDGGGTNAAGGGGGGVANNNNNNMAPPVAPTPQQPTAMPVYFSLAHISATVSGTASSSTASSSISDRHQQQQQQQQFVPNHRFSIADMQHNNHCRFPLLNNNSNSCPSSTPCWLQTSPASSSSSTIMMTASTVPTMMTKAMPTMAPPVTGMLMSGMDPSAQHHHHHQQQQQHQNMATTVPPPTASSSCNTTHLDSYVPTQRLQQIMESFHPPPAVLAPPFSTGGSDNLQQNFLLLTNNNGNNNINNDNDIDIGQHHWENDQKR